jgi:RNA polymerase sigma-54 factor
MAVKLSQSLKQTQNLMMTPQLQQAIKLLTLTHLEMTNVIAEEMVENPMLEELDGSNGSDKDAEFKEANLENQNKEATAENFQEETIVNKDDFDWQSYIETYNNTSSSPPSMATPDHDEMPNYENIVSRGQTLAEHLEWQLRMEEVDQQTHDFAMTIIHSTNDDGYLDTNFEDLLAETDLDREDAYDCWSMVKRLDPVGCSSQDLVDCLLSQAVVAEERSPLLEKIIREHLGDLRDRNIGKIAKALNVTEDQVKTTAELLKNFHPKPGRLVSPAETHYVVPDIYVVQMGSEFVVKVNDDGVPRLKISQLYQNMLKQTDNSTADFKTALEYLTP